MASDIPFPDSELFSELDIDITSSADLASYLRSRTTVPWTFDFDPGNRDFEFNRDTADATVAGHQVQQEIAHDFPHGEVQWLYNVTRERDDLPVNNEWQWQLNRMGYWRNLGHAWRSSHDERYAQTFVSHLRSWAQQCPRPSDHGNYATSAWRTIESGIRMAGSWPDAFHLFLHAPAFTNDDIALYLKLCIEHGRHLRQNHRASGNWLAMEMAGLYTIGAVFPELTQAESWRRYAIDHAYEELDNQFTPDGAQIELSTGYHWVALRNLVHIPMTARVVERDNELPADFIDRARKAFDFTLLMRAPDGSTPRVNDTPNTQDVASILSDGHSLFPDRTDYLWAATETREGTPPTQVSHYFDHAGYALLRSGWENEANLLCFDVGPAGHAHIHQDKLNIQVWAFGREVLLDTGGGPYEQSPWRRYGTSTFSHNTAIVDGQPQKRERAYSPEPLADVTWVSTESYDFASGIYEEAYGETSPATHARSVLFIKPDLYLVVDTLTPLDSASHTYQVRWHFKKPDIDHDLETGSVSSNVPDAGNLAVVPLITDGLTITTASAQEEPELLGWWIRKRVEPKALPAATVLHDREGKGAQRFATLLVPLRPGERNPVAAVDTADDECFSITFADGHHAEVQIASNGALRYEGVRADGARRLIDYTPG